MSLINAQYLKAIGDIVALGKEVKPRDLTCLELTNHQFVAPMTHPIITLINRKLSYRFMAAEAAWMLSGDNRVSSISKYCKAIYKFSDDGIFFFGAYGPKIIDQISYAADCLRNDIHSRQAVINIWRENPRPSKDVPCTLSLQFLIRDGAIHTIATMRSQDVWLGLPYDFFNFTAVTSAVALMLREAYYPKLGKLSINAGSRHLYCTNLEAARSMFKDPDERRCPEINLIRSTSVDDIVAKLYRVADKKDSIWDL